MYANQNWHRVVLSSTQCIVSYIDSCNCFYPTWLCKFNLFITPIPISLSILHTRYTEPSSDNSLDQNHKFRISRLESFDKFWQRFHIGMLILYFIATHFSFFSDFMCFFYEFTENHSYTSPRFVNEMCVWKYASRCLLILWMNSR